MPIDKSLAKKAFAEFLGMTMFVYIGTGAVVSTGEQLASSAAPTAASVARVLPISFAFGMSIMVQAFSFGHISGGHFNPAVSFFMYLIDKIKLDQFLCFVAAQIAGAFMGSLLLWGSVSGMSEDRSSVQEQVIGSPPFNLGANGLNAALSPGNGFLLELMGTFLLCMAVMMTTQHSNSLSQGAPHMAPLAIGFAVFLAHVVLVPLTGCGINPARSLGKTRYTSFFLSLSVELCD
uniref:Aquaporin n=1 Tax=Amphora coffeiformis TaxID=265554 RepID=A0A7S3P433_9STRA